MNQIEHIRESFLSRFDGIVATIGAPVDRERGAWFLDIQRGRRVAAGGRVAPRSRIRYHVA